MDRSHRYCLRADLPPHFFGPVRHGHGHFASLLCLAQILALKTRRSVLIDYFIINKKLKDEIMTNGARSILTSCLLLLGGFTSLGPAQQPPAPPASIEAVQVIGLTGVRQNTKGSLKVDKGSLTFASPKNICAVPAASIQDVVTGADSQRVIGGTVGTLSRLGPYGSGTALSLLRSKVDIITIQYRDPNGALHGAIFTMPFGKAESIKEALLAQGAHTSIPSQAKSTVNPPLQSEAMEQTN